MYIYLRDNINDKMSEKESSILNIEQHQEEQKQHDENDLIKATIVVVDDNNNNDNKETDEKASLLSDKSENETNQIVDSKTINDYSDEHNIG